MKSDNMRESSNVEDRRGQSSGSYGGRTGMGMGSGGLGLLLQLLLSGRGGSKWLILIVLAFMIFGGGFSLTDMFSGSKTTTDSQIIQQEGTQTGDLTDAEGEFLSKVLASTEDFWTKKFQEEGRTYTPTTLVLYSGATATNGCGVGQAQAGPFYCPGDKKVYIDTSFIRELANRYGAKGDFAMAYVLAHEVGHHVQNEVGLMDEYNQARQGISESQANQLNVRLELQADYLAGAWANYVQGEGLLDQGDIEEAIQAAYSVGDDTLQEKNYGRVMPDTFTHGSSEQRTKWFKRGFQYGDFEHGDTFSGSIDI
ncbi:KPN_02809 family neutral zinc metallopeptidase [Eremococcus coleocola]|uniref:Putative neutral zinc metallopeptidase n=1 Tax=Eremococcus coleocola ACS-139-V-Col8 TaxID=908337 RepID=E4KPY6_9LACT|nr:neutral zinc metallopeptidase [Eremococcus coleocola]EFR31230.1 putative neutral zinc metallopeptidase [Eremococcus coleocola ACS-139-V-Col8]